MRTIADPVAEVLFGKTRQAVMALFFTRPDEQFHLREVVRLTGVSPGAVQRELKVLAKAGILTHTRRGNQTIYQADASCSVFHLLKELVVRTVGLADLLRQALLPLQHSIRVALLFGSFASGQHRATSDVDVLVVGELPFADLVAALRPVQQRTGREVNPVLYTPSEFREGISSGNQFLTSVLASPVVFVLGDERELAAIRKERLARVSPNLARRDRQPAGSRPAGNAGRAGKGTQRRRPVSARL